MPEVAVEVGYLVMICANFDCWMHPALSTMLNEKPGVAEAVITRIESISAKFEILCDVAAANPESDMAKVVIENRAGVKAALQFRNKVAHGMFGFQEDDGKIVGHILIPFPLSKKRGKPQSLKLDAKLIRPHTECVSNMIKGIRDITGNAYFL